MRQRMIAILALILLRASLSAQSGEAGNVRVLDEKMVHLGTAGMAEWAEFEGKTPHGRRLDLNFQNETANAGACTLFIRQDNVKYPWDVRINGKKIGELAPMEVLQVNAFELPAQILRQGENTLSIVAPPATDDILVGDIRLDMRPRDKVLNQAQLQIKVTDKQTRSGLPCRITLADPSGALAPLSVLEPNRKADFQSTASRTGVVYTRDGAVTLGVREGRYTLYATRGFEYSMAVREITAQLGQRQDVDLQIEREVPTPGLAACDTHIHTRTNHGDASLDERMLTIAGEGIEVAISTEHNQLADFIDAQTRTGLLDQFTSVVGCEVTTKTAHFNAFPITGKTPPDEKLDEWNTLLNGVRATPGVQVIILNHPRDNHGNFIPFGPKNFNPLDGDFFPAADLGVDAIEVINSGALQSDLERVYGDWFALLNRGSKIVGIGASDDHDVSRFILGQGRTYVACDDSNPGKIDVAQVCRSFREGRVSASMGLLADLRVNERFAPGDLATGLGEDIRVTATVLGPSWITADRVQLFANGVQIHDEKIPPTTAIQKAILTWTLRRPAQDTALVVIATGPGVTLPCWAIPRPYQPTSKTWTPRVIGSTNPIWLDADGDGKFTAPRILAQQLLAQAGNDPAKLLPLLETHDRAVALQAASLCHAAKLDIGEAAFQSMLKRSSQTVQAAFNDYPQASPTAQPRTVEPLNLEP